MNECQKMAQFIDDNYALEYIIYCEQILPRFYGEPNNNNIGDISDIDIDIID